MPLITFISDFGQSDHYVAFTKARILREHPEAQIIDISHDVKPFNLAHIAFVLKSVFREFPAGTIHLIGNDADSQKAQSYIIAQIEEHIFIGANNGVMSLISDKPPEAIYQLEIGIAEGFKELPSIAAKLAKHISPETLGSPTDQFNEYMPRKARATKKEIAGHVIHTDHYGNLITNIEKTDFDILSANRAYTIVFGRDIAHQVNRSIPEVDPGEVFFIFNSNGQLMLGINQGHGGQLLGLSYDSPISIKFEVDAH
ncbi:SAM hydrolase/SAM-dependent halogenase family protein [Roseivirga sp.]|uniref:SAM hydrolase/SAM-dependent halogenase family protein n=1 Tax=Roseivirga sp. TaxID=1964215 RepID=UPI003B8DF508